MPWVARQEEHHRGWEMLGPGEGRLVASQVVETVVVPLHQTRRRDRLRVGQPEAVRTNQLAREPVEAEPEEQLAQVAAVRARGNEPPTGRARA